MSHDNNADEVPKDLRVFAVRVARRCFLATLMAPAQVLETEEKLVEMARSKLQEFLISTLGLEGMERDRAKIETSIRNVARKWIETHSEDGYDVEETLHSISDAQLGDLFRIAN